MLTFLRELLFPVECAACGSALESSEASRGLCAQCQFPTREENQSQEICVRCSSPSLGLQQLLCLACTLEQIPFRTLRSLYLYRALAEKSLKALKYGHRRDLISTIADELAEKALPLFPHKDWDCIVPIPSDFSSLQARRFCHCTAIATQLAQSTGCRCAPFALRRTRPCTPQAQMNPEHRWENVAHIFVAHPSVAGKNLLMFDDVLTTGSTLWHGALALQQAGAASIDILTFSRAERFPRYRLARLLKQHPESELMVSVL